MTSFPEAKVLLVGAGKMGGALHAAWLRAGAMQEAIAIVEPKGYFAAGPRIHKSVEEVKDVPDVVVIAVKPQSMDELLPSLQKKFGASALYLSIAAGKTLAYFSKHLGQAPVIRAMPNTPAIVGKGISALVANRTASEAQKGLATLLLEAAGEVVWLEDESLMDAVTAISGSGPAYVFLFMDALVKAGVAQGLPEVIARRLALYTVRGSAKLALKSEDSLEQLRINVTSPGGTTEAALKVLMKQGGLESLIDEAVKAALKRSKELA